MDSKWKMYEEYVKLNEEVLRENNGIEGSCLNASQAERFNKLDEKWKEESPDV